MKAMIGLLLLALGGAVAMAEESPVSSPPAPEMDILKRNVGLWAAKVEINIGPGQPPEINEGMEDSELICGGLWLRESFKSTLAGEPFEGMGLTGYDPKTGKYKGVWVDSMVTAPVQTEATYDKEKDLLTYEMDGVDADGKPIKMRCELKWMGEDQREWTAYMKDEAGAEFVAMKISYSRSP